MSLTVRLRMIDAQALYALLTDEPQGQVVLARKLGWLRGPDSNGHMRANRRRVGAAAKWLLGDGKCWMRRDPRGRCRTHYVRGDGHAVRTL